MPQQNYTLVLRIDKPQKNCHKRPNTGQAYISFDLYSYFFVCYYPQVSSHFILEQENSRTVRHCPLLLKTTIIVVHFAHTNP